MTRQHQAEGPWWAGNTYTIRTKVVDEKGRPRQLDLGAPATLVYYFRTRPEVVAIFTKAYSVGVNMEVNTLEEVVARVLIAAADTHGLQAGTYFHELIYTSPTGQVATLFEGFPVLRTSGVV